MNVNLNFFQSSRKLCCQNVLQESHIWSVSQDTSLLLAVGNMHGYLKLPTMWWDNTSLDKIRFAWERLGQGALGKIPPPLPPHLHHRRHHHRHHHHQYFCYSWKENDLFIIGCAFSCECSQRRKFRPNDISISMTSETYLSFLLKRFVWGSIWGLGARSGYLGHG